MAQRALISHMKSKKHSDSVAVRSGTSAQQSIGAHFSTSSTSKAVDNTSVTDSHMGSSEDNDDRSLVSAHVITDSAIAAEVKKAEIIWAIKTVLGHISYNFISFRCLFILLSRESDQSSIGARLGVASHLFTTPRWGNPAAKCLSQWHK